MDIEKLRSVILEVKPYLDNNLNISHQQFLCNELTEQEFNYIKLRYETALIILQNKTIEAEEAYKSARLITIDLRNYIFSIVNKEEKEQALIKLNIWLDCFKEAGFTETDTVFNVPSLPNEMVI